MAKPGIFKDVDFKTAGIALAVLLAFAFIGGFVIRKKAEQAT